VFGPVVTLQNVAVISSMQKTPVVGATVGVDWTGGPPNCCTLDDVASCAAAGDAAKSNAEINANFFIVTSLSLGASQ
jgi:hypothetical protein